MHNPVNDWLAAPEAAQLLGVQRATLYAYVSRGWLRARSERGVRLYSRADLETLRARSDARRGHAAVAGGALRFGEPVLDSRLTRVDVGGPVYRGYPAVELAARGTPPESVAELLWTAELPAVAPSWPVPRHASFGVPSPSTGLAPLLRVLSAQPSWRPRELERELVRARRLVRRLAASYVAPHGQDRRAQALLAPTLAASLCVAFDRPNDLEVARAVACALVVVADHELNASAFAARVAAGAGADLPRCLLAALATLSGSRHGGESEKLERVFRGFLHPEHALRWVRKCSEERRHVSGFGHVLYPGGDPRAEFLMRYVSERSGNKALRAILVACEAMELLNGERPNLDLALVALCLAFELPAGAALTLFAVGRCVGHIAHILEQREQGHLLRPRARYIGV